MNLGRDAAPDLVVLMRDFESAWLADLATPTAQCYLDTILITEEKVAKPGRVGRGGHGGGDDAAAKILRKSKKQRNAAKKLTKRCFRNTFGLSLPHYREPTFAVEADRVAKVRRCILSNCVRYTVVRSGADEAVLHCHLRLTMQCRRLWTTRRSSSLAPAGAGVRRPL
jgi:hypothetical protein